jgi:hypothetical protein
MSRHRNFQNKRLPSPPGNSERQRQDQAALRELLDHGGSQKDVRQLQEHFREAAEDPPSPEIPE